MVVRRITDGTGVIQASDEEEAGSSEEGKEDSADSSDDGSEEQMLASDCEQQVAGANKVTREHPPGQIGVFSFVEWALERASDLGILQTIIGNLRGPVSVGSLCSGLGVFEMVCDALHDLVSVKWPSVNCNIVHEFACEIDKGKQDYLKQAFHLGALFNDVADVGRGRAFDARASA
jgi:hypothetical protein